MMTKTTKKLFVLYLLMVMGIEASAYNFCAVNSDGKTIFYNILSSTDLTCEVTTGDYDYSGNINIPANATNPNDSKTYSVTSIGQEAFYYCSGLTTVTIPDSVTNIRNRAFYKCTSLTAVTIPNSVTSIENSAFEDCSGLTAVHITDIDKWTEINFSSYEANPLYYAQNLYLNGSLVTDAKLTDATKIGNYAFYNYTKLTSITISNSVISIGRDAFHQCDGLKEVTIPNSVTSIGNYAFQNCSGLQTVMLGNSVTSIGVYAFDGCKGLTEIEIPNSVTSIENWAFMNCRGLMSITVSWKNPLAKVYRDTFDGVDKSKCVLYVLTGTKALYAEAFVWQDFTNIEEYNDPAGIKDVSFDSSFDEQELYNLQGQKVTSAVNGQSPNGKYQGIVIKHGRKYLVK